MKMPAPVGAFFPSSMPLWGTYNPHQQHYPPPPSPLTLFPPSAFPPLLPPPMSIGIPNPLSPSAAPSPTFPSNANTPSPPAGSIHDCTEGVGSLIWLSSKAGLIRSEEFGMVSFQMKDFCDQAVNDLTSVLRPGFTLQFWANQVDGSSWLATFVRPLPGSRAGSDPRYAGQRLAADLESLAGVETGPPQLPKDPYNLELEAKAVPMLLGIFQRQGSTYCPLSSFHMQISNCGDEALYRYVGTSSLKRRQFLERRSHLFSISTSDTVSLQPPALYTTLVTLVRHMLKRGGACLLQDLFDHFNACPEIPLEARDGIGEGKPPFLHFLEAHPWLIAVFPSRVFVAVRRQLPPFDYPAYINQHFGDMEPTSFSAVPAKTNGCQSASSSGSSDDGVPHTPGLAGPYLDPVLMTLPLTPLWNAPPTPIDLKPALVNGFGAPPPGVGGRIKRFTDMEIQTDHWMPFFRPPMSDAETQTETDKKVTTASGPGDSELTASETESEGKKPDEDVDELLSGLGLFDPFAEPPGYDPMSDGPDVLSRGLMLGLQRAADKH